MGHGAGVGGAELRVGLEAGEGGGLQGLWGVVQGGCARLLLLLLLLRWVAVEA